MARSKTATAEAIFWQAIEAFALRARTTSLDRKGRPGNVTLARTLAAALFDRPTDMIHVVMRCYPEARDVGRHPCFEDLR